MKRYVSRFLKTIALLWMAAPVAYPVTLVILFDIPIDQSVRLLVSPILYLAVAVAAVAGYGLWEMRRWAWYVFLLSHVIFIYANIIFAWDHGTSHHKGLVFAMFLAFQMVTFFRVAREVRVPWFFPKIRWWESDPRYKLSVPAKMVRIGGHEVDGEILDISQGGCFVKVRADLLQDELLSMRFSLFGMDLVCDGFVVWRTQSTVTHPRGIGFKFTALGRHDKRALRVAIRKLKRAQIDKERDRLQLKAGA